MFMKIREVFQEQSSLRCVLKGESELASVRVWGVKDNHIRRRESTCQGLVVGRPDVPTF